MLGEEVLNIRLKLALKRVWDIFNESEPHPRLRTANFLLLKFSNSRFVVCLCLLDMVNIFVS